MFFQRTTTRDVAFDGKRLSVVRLNDGAPELSFAIPDAETKDAIVAALTYEPPPAAPIVETPKASTTKKRATKKAASETAKETEE